MTQKAHVAEYKKEIVKDFADLMSEYPIIAIVNMENMPAPQLQKMRQQIRANVVLRMTKRRLINLAIDKVKDKKKNIEALEKYLGGMPAVMFTKENPFKLANMLNKSKSNAPAKAGQVAPKDIIVNAGPTPFAPGPVIGELGLAGIKTQIESGKVAIKEDTVVVKKGEIVKDNVASILLRLGIEPMEIGMDLVAAYEGGLIFTKEVLSVDEKEYLRSLINAHNQAFNLSIEAGYYCKETIEFLLSKLFKEAKSLALSQNIMSSETVGNVFSKAQNEMIALSSAANFEVKQKEVRGVIKETREEMPKEAPKDETVKGEKKLETELKDKKIENQVDKIVERMKKHAKGEKIGPSTGDLLN